MKVLFAVRIKSEFSELRMDLKTVIFVLNFPLIFPCDFNFPQDNLNACDFDPLLLLNADTGFVIAGENCGLEVSKDVFEDQPFVFYSEAQDLLKYTLIMVDQDADVDEENLYLHWMLADVPVRLDFIELIQLLIEGFLG